MCTFVTAINLFTFQLIRTTFCTRFDQTVRKDQQCLDASAAGLQSSAQSEETSGGAMEQNSEYVAVAYDKERAEVKPVLLSNGGDLDHNGNFHTVSVRDRARGVNGCC